MNNDYNPVNYGNDVIPGGHGKKKPPKGQPGEPSQPVEPNEE